jgi:nucleotide-binding universal stress UspA family protein
MRQPDTGRGFRVLVATDASAHSQAAIDAAVVLARGDDAQLLGLFIEDDNLLRFVALPFAWVTPRYGGGRLPLTASVVLAEMQAQARAAAAALARAATAGAVRWQFRTLRGPWPATLVDAAEDADLVTVGRAGRRHRAQPGIGVVLPALARRSSASTLIVSHGQRAGGPVLILDAGTELSPAAERLGAEVAARLGAVHETMAGSSVRRVDDTEAADATAHAQLHPAVAALATQLDKTAPGLLVLPADWPLLEAGGLSAVLDWLPCPVLLAR